MSEIAFFRSSPKGKLDALASIMESSGVAHGPIATDGSVHRVDVKVDGKHIRLNFILRALGTGGWKDKPWIYRIQIGVLGEGALPRSGDGELSLLLGLFYLDGSLALAAWNPFMYVFHKTNRSCYLKEEDIQSLAKEPSGVFVGKATYPTPILCREDSFRELLSECLKRYSL